MIDDAFLRVCSECKREFDLLNDVDAEEWAFGHDCESVDEDFERVFGGGY